jgi:hypothetical protein
MRQVATEGNVRIVPANGLTLKLFRDMLDSLNRRFERLRHL